jgi:hypothetical protein
MYDAATPLVDEIWSAGFPESAHPDVEFTGPERIFPSSFGVDALAQATVSSALAGVSFLSGGDTVFVDTRHVAAAFSSERALSIDGTPPAAVWDPIAGNYKTDDGWIRLHTNFAHHRDAALRALRCANDPAAVAAAAKTWPSNELEAMVIAEGGAAAAMHSLKHWRAHPHGSEVRTRPIVGIESAGISVAEPVQSGDAPLSGVRVLDLTRVIAGPVAGRFLAAFGADVIRVDGPELPDVQTCLIDGGFGKRFTETELTSPAGRSDFLRLVAGADVVIRGYRPGALDALGVSVRDMTEARPGLVTISLSAYGAAGPWAQRRGFDSLVQLSSGIADGEMVASGSDQPRALPCQALDHATGYLAAFAALAGLARRSTEGGSWHGEVSLARTAAMLTDAGSTNGNLDTDDPGDALFANYLLEDDTPFGRVTHVSCPGRIDAYTPSWSRPPGQKFPIDQVVPS